MTPEIFHWIMIVVVGVSGFFLAWSFKLILSLNDRLTTAEEKARNHTAEIDRRFTEFKADVERRFQDKRDDLVSEKLLIDLKIKGITDLHDTQSTYLKQELSKIEVSMNALHRRLDDFLNTKANN